MRTGKLIVISGPSGVGKTTIVNKLLGHDGFVKITTATTRARRPNEQDGRHYHFMTREAFLQGIDCGDFLEHAEIFGNLYGTRRKPVEEALAAGKIAILEIDIQGAESVRQLKMDAFFIFIMPPDAGDLRKRLTGRESEKSEEILIRLRRAEEELLEADRYDLRVVNDDLDDAVNEILTALTQRGIYEPCGGKK